MQAADTAFLRARLAAATAVSDERRTPEIAAFIETCQLQQELADALDMPEGRTVAIDQQWTLVRALKFARAAHICEGVPLNLSFRLSEFALDQLQALQWETTHSISEVMRLADTRLDTVAKAAAAWSLVTIRDLQLPELLGLLKSLNESVALLQQPAVRQRLRRELAAVEQQEGWQILSYEQLLSIFIEHGASEVLVALLNEAAKNLEALHTAATLRSIRAEALTAYTAITELLPRLVPDKPRTLYLAVRLIDVALEKAEVRLPLASRRAARPPTPSATGCSRQRFGRPSARGATSPLQTTASIWSS